MYQNLEALLYFSVLVFGLSLLNISQSIWYFSAALLIMGLSQFTNEDGRVNERQRSFNAAEFDIMTSVRADSVLVLSSKNTLLSFDDPIGPSQFYMLRYHRDRMLEAAKELDWTETYKDLAGSRGLSYLKGVLQDYLATLSDGANHPRPLKVYASVSRKLFSD